MKKHVCGLIIAALLLPCVLFGCADATADNEGLTIVTTTFSAYDWVRNIVGEQEGVDVILLPDNGEDMHTYQFTAKDIITLTSCDLLVYVGGVDDATIENALQNTKNPPAIVNLMETLGDGLLTSEETHADGSDADTDHEHAPSAIDEADEHVWLSLKNAAIFCRAITDKLVEIDPSHADNYAENAEDYMASIVALDADYQKAVDTAARRTLLFADRFPFRYLMEDYGLDYTAAFAGCSADTSASFDTVIRLAKQIDAQALPCVLVIKDSPVDISAGIIQNTVTKDQTVLTLDALQSVTATEASDATYLGIMKKNLDVITSALN